jgi:purine-binding chemotaxis protein CheW
MTRRKKTDNKKVTKTAHRKSPASDRPAPENLSGTAKPVPFVSGNQDRGRGESASPGNDIEKINSAHALMPASEKDQYILRQRAAAVAGEDEQDHDEEKFEDYLRFRLGSTEEYGIPYHYLDEVLYISSIARIPCTPAHIAGVINRRGEMLTVLDLQPFFQFKRDQEFDDDARVIVISGHNLKVGILADAVISNDQYDPEVLAPPLKSGGVMNLDYVDGICDGKVTMLNVQKLLVDSSIIVNEAM